MKGLITTDPDFQLENRLEGIRSFYNTGLVKRVTPAEVNQYTLSGPRVAVLDLGCVKSDISALTERECAVTVFPAYSPVDDILRFKPEGILITNGPGDPKDCTEIAETVRMLMQNSLSIFGIGLGHLIIARASGMDTIKMKCGHHGGQPVKDVSTGQVCITHQNHGYVIDTSSVNESIAEVTYINMNDKSVEGLQYIGKPVFGVQFYPEAFPELSATPDLFSRFIENIKTCGEEK